MQRVLDYLGEQQRKLEEKNVSAEKQSPASFATPRRYMNTREMACETMITSANFDFEGNKPNNFDKLQKQFFEGCQEQSPRKRLGDFVIDVPEGSPQKLPQKGSGSLELSTNLAKVMSFGKTVDSPEFMQGDSPSQMKSPTLNMLGEIEKMDDEARSQRSHKMQTKIKKKKTKKSMKLNLLRAPSDVEQSDKKIILVKKLKPLLLNDSWEDLKPAKNTGKQAQPKKPEQSADSQEQKANKSSEGANETSSPSSSESSGGFQIIEGEVGRSRKQALGEISPTRHMSPEMLAKPNPHRRSSVRKVSQKGNFFLISPF